MTTFKEAQNQAKQIKNAKRGGYTPTIAKDVNKRKVQKIEAYIKELKDSLVDFIEADLYDKGVRRNIESTIDELTEILRSK
ncbi:hypothetical protein GPS50_04220 [Acinetobacter haemolyticus]|uniref:hypothetical protein n=1 Tax=Acinetobacter haemolyticus TaxID=29430 RepID=UPI0013733D78|nr:hypothetical protein [Acinetobacter haemolyticus]NAR78951.1 hypothetical protein [Acinetobacter haemolyticus]